MEQLLTTIMIIGTMILKGNASRSGFGVPTLRWRLGIRNCIVGCITRRKQPRAARALLQVAYERFAGETTCILRSTIRLRRRSEPRSEPLT
jgi:hypothetical protein